MTVQVNKPSEITKAYNNLVGVGAQIDFEIVRIQNRLKEELPAITLNFIYQNLLIGEIEIKTGLKAFVNQNANQLYYDLRSANSVL